MTLEQRLLGDDGATTPLTYEETKELAAHADPRVREALASRPDIKPELLYFLAEDPSPDVRRTAAANRATPLQADLKLAIDEDEEVRAALARKVSSVAPGLTGAESDRLRRTVYEALLILTRDQITRIRQILSESLKDVIDAPHDVMRRLASDLEYVVAGPVLECSPVLTDEDLVEIIATGPAPGGLGAISRRARVSERVSDAVAGSGDLQAIADLLSNPSAQIREETLDGLIDRAPGVELWHLPLAARPRLSKRAVNRLARFLADNLIDVLRRRTDLPSEVRDSLPAPRRRPRRNGPAASCGRAVGAAPPSTPDFMTLSLPVNMARGLHDAGRLDRKVIVKALESGDYAFVLAALVVRVGIRSDIVKEIFAKKDARAIVAVAWKADLPIELAVRLQHAVAGILTPSVLDAAEGGRYPLEDDEMAEVLAGLDRG